MSSSNEDSERKKVRQQASKQGGAVKLQKQAEVCFGWQPKVRVDC